MLVELKMESPASGGGVAELCDVDSRRSVRVLSQNVWQSRVRENAPASEEKEDETSKEQQISPGLVITTTVSQPDWVTVEVENGHLRVDRSRFSPEQEAYYQASQFMSRRDWSNAAQAFRKVLELNPFPLLRQGVTMMVGIAYFHEKDLDQAALMFEEAIRLDQQNDFAHLFLGTARMESGHFEEAIGPLRKSLELNPHGSHVHFYLGCVYEELGQWERAITSYRAEIENHMEATEAYEHLAKLYMRLGDDNPAEMPKYYVEAIKTYKKWAEVEPSNSAVRNLIGYLYTQVGNLDAATEAFARAVEVKPDNLIALSNWGVAYLNAERNKEAKEIFERLASFGEEKVRELLSQTSRGNLDEDVRLAMAETFQLLGAANLKLYQSQAQTCGEEAGDRTLLWEAEASFKKALEYNPADVHSLHNLGLVYYMSKRWASAATLFRKVLELNPDFPDTTDVLHTVLEGLERWRRQLEVYVGEFAASSSKENPVHTEELVEKLAECRAKLFEGVDAGHEDDVFTPEDLLNAMFPMAEWLSEGGNDEVRFAFSALIFDRGWLSSGKAARLAGVNRVTFLTNLYRVGIAALDLDEKEMENQSRYVNAE